MAARQWSEAIGSYHEALAVYRQTSDRSQVATLESEWAEALLRAGRAAEARPVLDRLVADRGASLAPPTRRALWLLAEVARRQGRLGDARRLLTEAIAGEVTSMAPVPGGAPTPTYIEVLSARARAYLAMGDRAAALPPADEADRFWREFAPASPDAQDAARLYVQAGGLRR